MKKNVSPAIIIGAIVVMVALLGFISYKTFGPRNLPGIENEEMRKKYMPNGYPYPVSGQPNKGTTAPVASEPGKTQQYYQQQYQQQQQQSKPADKQQ